MDITTIGYLKKYIEKILVGLGIIKGSQAKIKSITPTYSTLDPTVVTKNTITFEWDAQPDPTIYTPVWTEETMTVVDNGRQIYNIAEDKTQSTATELHYVVQYYDGSTGTLLIPRDFGGLKRSVVTTLPLPTAADHSTIYMVEDTTTSPKSYLQYISTYDITTATYVWVYLGSTATDLTQYMKKIDSNLIARNDYKNPDPDTQATYPTAASVPGAINEHEDKFGAKYDYTNNKITGLNTYHNANVVAALNDMGSLVNLHNWDGVAMTPANLVDAINGTRTIIDVTTLPTTDIIKTSIYRSSADTTIGSTVYKAGIYSYDGTTWTSFGGVTLDEVSIVKDTAGKLRSKSAIEIATFPSSPLQEMLYRLTADTTVGTITYKAGLYVHDGTNWVAVGAAAVDSITTTKNTKGEIKAKSAIEISAFPTTDIQTEVMYRLLNDVTVGSTTYTKGLYVYDVTSSAWVAVGAAAVDNITTTKNTDNELKAKSAIEITAFPTTKIQTEVIYRLLNDVTVGSVTYTAGLYVYDIATSAWVNVGPCAVDNVTMTRNTDSALQSKSCINITAFPTTPVQEAIYNLTADVTVGTDTYNKGLYVYDGTNWVSLAGLVIDGETIVSKTGYKVRAKSCIAIDTIPATPLEETIYRFTQDITIGTIVYGKGIYCYDATTSAWISLGAAAVDNKTVVKNSNNELRAKSALNIAAFPTTDILEETIYYLNTATATDRVGCYIYDATNTKWVFVGGMEPDEVTAISKDSTGAPIKLRAQSAIEITAFPTTPLSNVLYRATADITVGTDVYKAGLYVYDSATSAWLAVGGSPIDEVTIVKKTDGKIRAKSAIKVSAFPTTDILEETLYYLDTATATQPVGLYLYNGTEWKLVGGQPVDEFTIISKDSSGAPINLRAKSAISVAELPTADILEDVCYFVKADYIPAGSTDTIKKGGYVYFNSQWNAFSSAVDTDNKSIALDTDSKLSVKLYNDGTADASALTYAEDATSGKSGLRIITDTKTTAITTDNKLRSMSFIDVTDFPTTDILQNVFYRLTADTTTHKKGIYYYDGTQWLMATVQLDNVTVAYNTNNEIHAKDFVSCATALPTADQIDDVIYLLLADSTVGSDTYYAGMYRWTGTEWIYLSTVPKITATDITGLDSLIHF